MSRADLVDFVRDSDLKGRGGAGFPTGMKWGFCAAEKADQKYIICNADEGEPGTFKDRVILTRFADLVFEGMTIGGRAIGASLGIIYLRAEYTYLRPHLNEVIQRRRGAGLLGHNILRRRGLRLRHPRGHGRRRLRVRRGDRPHREPRGLPRRAAQPPAVPGGRRPAQQPDGGQQRRDARLGGGDLRQGRRLVQDVRHRQVDRLQAVQHQRRLREARRLRVPVGHHGGPPARRGGRDRRQGRPDRRRQRRLRPGQGLHPRARRSRTSPPAAR